MAPSIPHPKSPAFIPLHPREGIYCLNPEIPRKTFRPAMSSAEPWGTAFHFDRNKINTLRGPRLQMGKPALGPWGLGGGAGVCAAGLSPSHGAGAAWREDTWHKMGTPLNSESGLDLASQDVSCLRTKLCTLGQVECPLWASHAPHCPTRGLFFTLALLSIEVLEKRGKPRPREERKGSAQQGQGSAGIQPSSESPREELQFPVVVFKLSSVEPWGFREAPQAALWGTDRRK